MPMLLNNKMRALGLRGGHGPGCPCCSGRVMHTRSLPLGRWSVGQSNVVRAAQSGPQQSPKQDAAPKKPQAPQAQAPAAANGAATSKE